MTEHGQKGNCHLCNSLEGTCRCKPCGDIPFCEACCNLYHQHPRRRHHLTQVTGQTTAKITEVAQQPESLGASVQLEDSVQDQVDAGVHLQLVNTQDDLDSLIPMSWECTHCTYENCITSPICEMCDKTPNKHRKVESVSRGNAIRNDLCSINGFVEQGRDPEHSARYVDHQEDNELWKCSHCTYMNPSNRSICEICSRTTGRDKVPGPKSENKETVPLRHHSSLLNKDSHLDNQWQCEHCSYDNLETAHVCTMCSKTNRKYLSLPAHKTSSLILGTFEHRNTATLQPVSRPDDKSIRRFQVENNIPSKERAMIALHLMDKGHPLIDATRAARETTSVVEAEVYLLDNPTPRKDKQTDDQDVQAEQKLQTNTQQSQSQIRPGTKKPLEDAGSPPQDLEVQNNPDETDRKPLYSEIAKRPAQPQSNIASNDTNDTKKSDRNPQSSNGKSRGSQSKSDLLKGSGNQKGGSTQESTQNAIHDSPQKENDLHPLSTNFPRTQSNHQRNNSTDSKNIEKFQKETAKRSHSVQSRRSEIDFNSMKGNKNKGSLVKENNETTDMSMQDVGEKHDESSNTNIKSPAASSSRNRNPNEHAKKSKDANNKPSNNDDKGQTNEPRGTSSSTTHNEKKTSGKGSKKRNRKRNASSASKGSSNQSDEEDGQSKTHKSKSQSRNGRKYCVFL